MTAVTRQFTEKWRVADKYDYLQGDYHDLDFGIEQFDLAILGHIIHSEGVDGEKELIAKVYRALSEQGLLIIGEFVPNDERTGPEMPFLFDLTMLVTTPVGGVFTMREYREWLLEAGFAKVRKLDVPAVSPLILARK